MINSASPTLLLLAAIDLTPWTILAIVAIGLVAGTLGGMLGVGGSVIMIPGLTWVFGFNQHLYQAAAMIANVAVATPAARRHYKAEAVILPVVKWMLPAALVSVALGVWLSNREFFRGDKSIWLGRILAVFLLYEVGTNIYKLVHKTDHPPPDHATIKPATCVGVGTIMGGVGGLLGIGGGAMAVPLQQAFLRLPLRNAIANSATVMVFSAAFGAIQKNYTLSTATLGQQTWVNSVALAALLAPSCWIGGRIGAGLTHKLPLRQVRIAFIILMTFSAWKLLAIPVGTKPDQHHNSINSNELKTTPPPPPQRPE